MTLAYHQRRNRASRKSHQRRRRKRRARHNPSPKAEQYQRSSNRPPQRCTVKTHLAIGLGVLTAQLGHRVYFTTAVDLAARLSKAVDGNRLHRELNTLNQPKLLILDEVGYLSLIAVQASLVFQVVCRRYQRGQSILLTSNKAFSEWGSVFGNDAVLAAAALDRLLHRSTVLNIKGESYRLKEKKKAGPLKLVDTQKGGDT
jgi:DNA replication protein DnaC